MRHRLFTTRNVMRIVAGGATQLSRALQKARGLTKPVARVRYLEILVLSGSPVEGEPEIRERLARLIGEWPAILPLEKLAVKP